jgi:hypothetical protein
MPRAVYMKTLGKAKSGQKCSILLLVYLSYIPQMTCVGAKLHFLCHMSNTIGSIFCVFWNYFNLLKRLYSHILYGLHFCKSNLNQWRQILCTRSVCYCNCKLIVLLLWYPDSNLTCKNVIHRVYGNKAFLKDWNNFRKHRK